MPTYRVTDPTSGRTLKLTGDSPPTEEELTQIFASQTTTNQPQAAPKQPRPQGQGFLQPEQRANLQALVQSEAEQTKQPGMLTKILASVQRGLGKEGAASAVIPVASGLVGNAIGGLTGGSPGAVAGGAVGAATGERLQQLLDPAKALGEGGAAGIALVEGRPIEAVLGNREDRGKQIEQGLISGALDVATLGAGKVLGGVGKSLGKAVEPAARAKIFQEAFTVNRQLAKKIGLPEASKKMVEYGISGNMDDIIRVTEEVTGSSGKLSTGVRNVLGQLDNQAVNIASALDDSTKAVKNATVVKDSIKNATEQNINNILNKTQSGLLEIKPLEAFDAIKELESQAQVFKRAAYDANGTIKDVGNHQISKAYDAAARNLEEQLDKLPAAKEVIETIKTPETIEALRQISPKLADEFQKATSLRELRALQRPFVSINKAANETLEGSSSTFNKVGSYMQNQGGFRGFPVVGNAVGAVQDVLTSAPVRTGLATAPERFQQNVNPETILNTVKGSLRPTEPTTGGLSREAVLQLLRSQMGQ